MPALSKIIDMIKPFDDYYAMYVVSFYNVQIRMNFINSFFEALNCDVNKRLEVVKVPHEMEISAGMIDAPERHINRLVYNFCGLTGDEVAITEGRHEQ